MNGMIESCLRSLYWPFVRKKLKLQTESQKASLKSQTGTMYPSGGRKESFFPSTTSQLGEGVGEGFKLPSPKLPSLSQIDGRGAPRPHNQPLPPSPPPP